MKHLFAKRHASQPDYHKYFDLPLQRKPFALISIYTILEEPINRPLTNAEIKGFVEKAHLNISDSDYAHIKYSTYNTTLRQRI